MKIYYLPRDQDARADKIGEVVESSLSDIDEDCDINIGLGAAFIILHVPHGRGINQLPFPVVLILSYYEIEAI